MKLFLQSFERRTTQPEIKVLFWLICGFPALWLTMLYTFVLRARVVLGVWPRPSHPDPKDLGFEWHYLIVMLVSLLLLCSPGLLLILSAFYPKTFLTERKNQWALIFYLLTFGMVCFVVTNDPRHFFEWFLD